VDGGRRATKGNARPQDAMRKTAATLIVLGLIWIGYTVWPLYDLFVLVRAIETRDVGTVLRHVNFGAVRVSLTEQVLAAYVRRTASQLNTPTQRMAVSAVGIADPVVNKLISPEALSDFLTAGWPVAVAPTVPPGTIGISNKTIGTFWQVFGNSEYGLGRFQVSAPAAVAPGQRFGLTFRLLQWRWKLSSVDLPESIQDLLADELIKILKAPATPR
jgi:hypothetical protein